MRLLKVHLQQAAIFLQDIQSPRQMKYLKEWQSECLRLEAFTFKVKMNSVQFFLLLPHRLQVQKP